MMLIVAFLWGCIGLMIPMYTHIEMCPREARWWCASSQSVMLMLGKYGVPALGG
jgi:hypothetical protein